MDESFSTGQLSPYKSESCPVFTPIKISNEILVALKPDESIKLRTPPFDSGFLNLYLLKFLAGDKNTSSGFADCAIDELYLWDDARVGSNHFVKNVCSAVNRFAQGLDDLSNNSILALDELTTINANMRPKKRNYGVRKSRMRAGNPKTNPNAFYCIPPELVVDYMHDYLAFYNNDDKSINKAVYALLQFIFIHPFRDGNGRLSRLLLINLVEKQQGFIIATLLSIYLKNIDKKHYHDCMKYYREGDLLTLKNFHRKAIEWANQSSKILSGFIDEYSIKIGQDNIDNDKNYSKVVIKTDVNQLVDESFFKFHSKKNGKNIYTNTALLNVLNQFDYYLRYELRKHQTN